jgi:hypothetical protein
VPLVADDVADVLREHLHLERLEPELDVGRLPERVRHLEQTYQDVLPAEFALVTLEER